jgi:hypothetical protein
MHYEFALDPAALADWQVACRMYEGFGFHRGRLLARVPYEQEWRRRVHEATQQAALNGRLQPVKRKSIVEKWLGEFVACMAPRARAFDNASDWLTNAEREHRLHAFRLVLGTSNPMKRAYVRVITDLAPDDESWQVLREDKVQRSPKALAAASQALISASREVLLVDPYFDPSASRWREALELCLRPCANARCGDGRLELHVTDTRSGGILKYDKAWFLAECGEHLPRCIPAGRSLRVFIWRQREKGEHLHPRYVLTEKGGMRFESGLDPGAEGETTDVSLMEPSLREARWREYQKESSAFELVNEMLVSGTLTDRIR